MENMNVTASFEGDRQVQLRSMATEPRWSTISKEAKKSSCPRVSTPDHIQCLGTPPSTTRRIYERSIDGILALDVRLPQSDDSGNSNEASSSDAA